MPKMFARRVWFSWGWLKGWSWPERIILLTLGLAPLGPLVIAGRDGGWVAGALALAAFIALNAIVYRRGGWGLLGPHFFYDVVRLARRGRSTVLRVLYIGALFVGLAFVYESAPIHRWRPNDFARISENFTFTLFMIQNLAVMILTPAYLGSAIAEERERRTLELLFTTQLTNREIILGKLSSRVIHLFGFVLAGFPILCLIQFWGGIDMVLIAGNLLNTLLNILSIGSICLLASTLARTVTGAVMTSYIVILPTGFCCFGTLRGFPFVLQDARVGGMWDVTVQDLGILCIVHLGIVVPCLTLAILALREVDPLSPVLPPQAGRLDVDPGPRPASLETTAIQTAPTHPNAAAPEPMVGAPHRREAEPADEFALPYTLPPIGDDPLLWKERYLGGPPWFFSPIVLVPVLPFFVTGFMVMAFHFLSALFVNDKEFRNAVETWSFSLKFFYYLCLSAYVLGVGFRAAAAVARERQQQTLEPLLLLPIDRGEILRAKLFGCLWRGWPWLGLLAANIALGTPFGAYHPLSAVMLCIAPWAFIFFIAGLGLLLSVCLSTVLRANLVMLIVFIAIIACAFVMPARLNPLGYLEPMAFSLLQFSLLQQSNAIDLAGSCVVTLVYVLAAAECLYFAFFLFERRSGNADS